MLVMHRAKETTNLIAENAIVALLYMGVGKLSLLGTFLDSNIGTLWPAAGIALAAILLRGYRILGGLFIGAVLITVPFANAEMMGLSFATAAANCLGPLAIVFLIDKTIGDRELLYTRVRSLVLLLGVCIPIGSFFSASILVASFYVFGFLASDAFTMAFVTFWVGNFLGFLIIGSFLLTWSKRPQFEAHSRNVIEVVVLVALLVVMCVFVFRSSYPFAYAPIIFLVWAAMRFHMHGATLGAIIVCGIAVTITSAGYGPFIVEEAGTILLNDSLLLLQLYIGFVTASALLLAATVIEKNKVQATQARIEGELNAAHDIQMSMVPLTFPAFPDRKEFDVYAILHPAKEVGGDFYDFFFIDEDHFCVCIGDVSGKGVASALFMAVTKTLIKSRASEDTSTASIISHVNDEVSSDNSSSMFVTIFLAIINLRSGDATYTNAGHNPPYLKPKGKSPERLEGRHGPVVGAMEGIEYKEERLALNVGDLLILYTDGITEAMNANRELFSEDRLVDLLKSAPIDSAEDVTRETTRAVKLFEGDTDQTDDITVLAFQYKGDATVAESGTWKMTVKNRLDDIPLVIGSIEKFCQELPVPLSPGRKLKIVMDEILSNIISYGYNDDDEHEIKIEVQPISKGIVLTIADDGSPFNPLDCAEPDTERPIDDREIGGLGVHLVRKMVDESRYERLDDLNILKLTLVFEREIKGRDDD